MRLERVPPGFFALMAVSAGLKLQARAVTDLALTRTPHGFMGRSAVGEGGQVYRQQFLLNPDGIYTGGECGCGQKGCPHLVRALLSPALERALEASGAGNAQADGPAPDQARPGQADPDDPLPENEAPPLATPLRLWLDRTSELAPGAGAGSGPGGRAGLRSSLRYDLSLPPPARGAGETLALRVWRGTEVRGEWQRTQPFSLPPQLRWTGGGSVPDSRLLPAYARADRDLLHLLVLAAQSRVRGGEETWLLEGTHPLTGPLLARLLESGRLHWAGGPAPLAPGPDRPATLTWDLDGGGVQRPRLTLPPGVQILPTTPRWYLDEVAGTLGRVTSPLPPALEDALRQAPPVPPAQAASFARALRDRFPGLDLPTPRPIPVRRETLPYQPVLTLREERVPITRRHARRKATDDERLGVAVLAHHYGGEPLDMERQSYAGGVLHLAVRDPAAEKRAAGQLTRTGLRRLQSLQPRGDHVRHPDAAALYAYADEARWRTFLTDTVPRLEAKGFRVEVDPSFPYRYAEVEDWYGETGEQGGWFTLELGVVVGGERHSLIPILVSLIAERPELFTPEALAALGEEDVIPARLPDGRRLALPAGRVRAMLSVLVELHLRELPPGPLRLPLLDAARLAALDEALHARWLGAERLLDLGRRLRSFRGVAEVGPPGGLHAELRPYQRQGLSWLQFLREYGLGGILADDMGLGKTLQTLAHLQTEKVSGRADRPSLVVAPTSVLGNWRAEAGRFTPGLRVLTLHGPGRRADFDRIPDHDLVLSTYPLLPRDVDALREHEFHLLVLDEAQNIKNPRSAAAKAAGALTARHRLALTGTPLENHLGELWSQFNFLAPGLLHDEKTFRELYRTPIEKQGDRARQAALAARVRPFILRREKREVATELPPKTEIPVRVTLDGDQRDLYETVRVTMLERVREELGARGLARSTVAILDALLKLRQAVTDPRLVRLEAAREVRSSAKLDWLTANLPQMVEEGRRILIFSQFATLLGLLEETLRDLGLEYAKLTGQTRDRAAQIGRFQGGEAPIFLISLKAGGVGLNLTAADTVIHLDPWWNPAAEAQATDRAYRIGQDKPVFVYKLIAAGSVEERILDLQGRKSALARGVLDGGLSSAGQLTTGDLERLFAPLEDEAQAAELVGSD
ncbi:DEAD/DEAH box helicase [Deinococcus budaensis]|uniref:Superfamily II DNA or RNA helicase n=1 Tax=Deinococcus budaensis TaxID=1665626 RepID=A0A7W8GDC0_9DEIO|nr:DEAD/DEAH box helicase [Deinococcus budaensis]MBB5233515.1 superfamily II DNA or RNA helicase [Deinococcus budaensis]